MPSEENKSKEQQAAESEVESFRKDLGPFVVAAETTRMAMVFTDAKEANHPLIFANDSFLSLAGYDREEVLGQSFDFLTGRPVDPGALAHVTTWRRRHLRFVRLVLACEECSGGAGI
jgi:PAS domain-containing protein